jgi:hypothetical protein
LSEKTFHDRENREAKKNGNIEQWPDSQNSPDPKLFYINVAVQFFFFDK